MIDTPSLSPTLVSPLDPTLVVALTCLMGIGLVTFALLRAWQDWIELKRRELENGTSAYRKSDDAPQLSVGAARIELADMKERIKKLEAIASGVEL